MRLSKLQKWILVTCHQEQDGKVYTAMAKIDILRYFKSTFTLGDMIFPIINDFKKFMTPTEYNKASATISRSIKNLRDKGLVRLIGHKVVEQPADKQACVDLATKYRTKEDLREAMQKMDIGEMASLVESLNGSGLKTEKIDIAVEITEDSKVNVKVVELTEKGIDKAKSLKLSPQTVGELPKLNNKP